MVSRTQYPEIAGRPEFGRSGVYALIGPSDDERYGSKIYIGQAGLLRTRLTTHLAGTNAKDFWTQCVVFTKRGEALDSTAITELEARLVRRARQAKKAELDNSNDPQGVPGLSEAQAADVDSFLVDVFQILRVLGIDAFELASVGSEQPADGEHPGAEYRLTLSGSMATGQPTTSGGFLVRVGSKASATTAPSMPASYRHLRDKLIEEGTLQYAEPGGYVLQEAYEFPSSSAAAVVFAGCSASGPQHWKSGTGQSLRDSEAERATTTAEAVK